MRSKDEKKVVPSEKPEVSKQNLLSKILEEKYQPPIEDAPPVTLKLMPEASAIPVVKHFETINIQSSTKKTIDKLEKVTQKQTLNNNESKRKLKVEPYPILKSGNFVPTRRIVHVDLKGAPPLVHFFESFFTFIAKLGATGKYNKNDSHLFIKKK